MAKRILKTTQSFGTKIKHWCLMQWHTTVTGVKFWRKSQFFTRLRMLIMKHFNTRNVRLWNVLELLTPKSKLNDNWCYMHCVKRYLLYTNWWLRYCFDSSCTWLKASKALTVSESIFRGRILWCFSLSKINISPAAPDVELILFPLWYWPIMNAHTKQQRDKVFETDFIVSQKSNPQSAHLSAPSHIYMT